MKPSFGNNFNKANFIPIAIRMVDVPSGIAKDRSAAGNFQTIMKLIFKIIAGINLLPILCCGQQIVWQNHYGGASYETTSSYNNVRILETPSGYVYAADTRSYDTFSGGNQYAIKIDNSGNLLWYLYAGDLYENDYPNVAIQTYDGNYFMAGMANMQVVNPGNIRLTKFTEQGDVIFSKIIIADSLYSTSATDICYTQDSNYIAACLADYNICLVKFNDNGDTVWTSLPMPDSLNFGVPLCFQPAPDYSAYYGVSVHNNYNYYWFKTDTVGQLLDLKRIGNPGQHEVDVRKAVMLPNGNILIYGGGMSPVDNVLCPNFNLLYDFLFEYNSEGEVIREKILCTPQFDGDLPYTRSFGEFMVADNGNIYFVFDKFIYKLNSDWEYEWADTLDIPQNAQLMKLAQFEYGYLIAAGQIQLTPDDIDIFMCKIALPEAIGIDEASDNIFNIYPNPFSNSLNIQNDNPHKTEYFIYDLSGRLLQDGSFLQSKIIDLKNLEEGVYIIQLQSQQGLESRKFVKL